MYMTLKLREQYEEAINRNLNTIRELIKKTNNLQEIAQALREKQGEGELVKRIIDEVKGINESIDELIDNTEDLYNTYQSFLRERARQ